jgi:hypothetical protein
MSHVLMSPNIPNENSNADASSGYAAFNTLKCNESAPRNGSPSLRAAISGRSNLKTGIASSSASGGLLAMTSRFRELNCYAKIDLPSIYPELSDSPMNDNTVGAMSAIFTLFSFTLLSINKTAFSRVCAPVNTPFP